jgi:hypothetical protein
MMTLTGAGALRYLPIPSEHRLPPSRTLLVAAFSRCFVGDCDAGCWVYDDLDAVDCVSDFVGGFGGKFCSMASIVVGGYLWLTFLIQSGFYPGCIFLLSCWYCRFEVQKRFSGFYLLALLASGFSNILAWALSLMKGVGGLNGWRWIFIMVSHLLEGEPLSHRHLQSDKHRY